MVESRDDDIGVLRLPKTLPIFPLPGSLLLPGCRLPLNIFEPRYLQMTQDAMAADGMIGMIQPLDADIESGRPRIHQVGCAGQVSSCRETADGRLRITLAGISRFRVVREVASDTLYRMVEPDWEPFADDLSPPRRPRIDREELVENLRAYFDARGLEANWSAIDSTDDADLVNALAMVCPFEPVEKQALLEAPDSTERGRLVTAIMNMAVLFDEGETGTLH